MGDLAQKQKSRFRSNIVFSSFVLAIQLCAQTAWSSTPSEQSHDSSLCAWHLFDSDLKRAVRLQQIEEELHLLQIQSATIESERLELLARAGREYAEGLGSIDASDAEIRAAIREISGQSPQARDRARDESARGQENSFLIRRLRHENLYRSNWVMDAIELSLRDSQYPVQKEGLRGAPSEDLVQTAVFYLVALMDPLVSRNPTLGLFDEAVRANSAHEFESRDKVVAKALSFRSVDSYQAYLSEFQSLGTAADLLNELEAIVLDFLLRGPELQLFWDQHVGIAHTGFTLGREGERLGLFRKIQTPTPLNQQPNNWIKPPLIQLIHKVSSDLVRPEHPQQETYTGGKTRIYQNHGGLSIDYVTTVAAFRSLALDSHQNSEHELTLLEHDFTLNDLSPLAGKLQAYEGVVWEHEFGRSDRWGNVYVAASARAYARLLGQRMRSTKGSSKPTR